MDDTKKFLVIPNDALDCLAQRFASADEATERASDLCARDGQSHYICELKAVVSRADRPVKVKKL